MELALHLAGGLLDPKTPAQRDGKWGPGPARPIEAWLALLCQASLVIQLVLHPECVVLGGGLSLLQGIDTLLAET
ncbi:hypothetical protein GCM10011415_39570 [Salipiger pallidus]|uniref:ROK family protein n=1 Tax=Salipiger pallidus TaxID=1775170 RepID=A0A8J2ZN97_9RHOB|nr:hypothetical protein GCM10011415_39570 [Salipiger pallidus]